MKPTPPATEFDTLIGSPSLQMMKAMLPFLEPSMQSWAAVYIQVQELTNTIALFGTPGRSLPWSRRATPTSEKLLEQLRPYGGPAEQAGLDQMRQTMEAMKLFQKIADLQKRANGPLSPMDLAKEMLPPEQAAMFETYSALFQTMDMGEMFGNPSGADPTKKASGSTPPPMDFGFFSQ